MHRNTLWVSAERAHIHENASQTGVKPAAQHVSLLEITHLLFLKKM